MKENKQPDPQRVTIVQMVANYAIDLGVQQEYWQLVSKEIYDKEPEHLRKIIYSTPSEETPILPSCHICGGETVLIRGKYPNTPQRNVCPCCAIERLEKVYDIVSPNYGETGRG